MATRRSSRLAVALLALGFAVPSSLAQKTKGQQDPTEKPRNVKPELKKAYKDWLEKDVTYIITDEERKAFKKLQTDDERERVIEEFWRRRDPDPDTDENEYREEYYERIAYANEHFASGIPGWKTDRGRIWIMYGKPDETESHPSGGAYNRESYEGGGSTSTYPFERWFYRYLPGVGSGIEIEFVDPTGSGEYRIARNPDEKDALLHVPGAGLTLAEQMGLADKGDRIANLGGIGTPNYEREQDSPFSRLQILTDLQRPPQIRFNDRATAGGRHRGFDVPKYHTGTLSTATVVLANTLEALGDRPAVGMFTIGHVKVIPNVSGTFHRGAPIGVYMQIHNAGIDQTTLRPSVDVEYVLMKDGKEVGKQMEDWRGNSDSGQRLTLARLIDSRQLGPGDYAIEVRVRDRVSGQSLVQKDYGKFTVVP